MLLPREKKIIELLYNKNEKKLTTALMATELQVSQRTIKADIKKINQLLEKSGCEISTKAGVGLWLQYTPEGERYLKTLLYNTERASEILPESRKYYVAVKLLQQTDFISMESISQELYISKGTVINDINELEDFWKRYELELIRKVKYGVRVSGEEKQIRIALAATMKKIVGSRGKGLVERVQPFFEDVNLFALKGALLEAEKKFGFILADISYFDFLVQMAIVVSRNKNGITYDWHETESEELQKEKEWTICEYLHTCMEFSEKETLNKAEIIYLTKCLRTAKFQSIFDKNSEDWLSRRRRWPEAYEQMMEALRTADEIYQLELSSDTLLICALFDHLQSMIKRAKDKMFVENPILDTVRRQLVYEYEIATFVTNRFTNHYGVTATEDEIGYVAFHIGASIERMMAKKTARDPEVTLVCATGLGTTQFLEAKLSRLFPNLKIAKVLPINKVDTLTANMQNFIISTVPLYSEELDIVCISPVLGDEDVKLIREHIRQTTAEEENPEAVYRQIQKFLHPDITIMQCDCKSKEEVIHLMGCRLMTEGYVDEGYIDSVLERERLAPAVIGNLFAIPHAFEGHILKQGIGLMTLKKPIVWGGEKVQIILMLALDSRAQDSFKGVFGEVVELTGDKRAVERLLRAKDFENLI